MDDELKTILDPENKLSDRALLVKKQLFNKYPRQLNKKERERMAEQKMMEDLEAEFQLMYGLDESDWEVNP